jgi:putative tryptophan/tyrosine transport system substrate-binding protein
MLNDLGYVEGAQVVYASRYAAWHREQLPRLLAEILADKPDLIFAFGEPAAEAVRDAATSVPAVFIGAGDAVATGLIAGLARPGRNMTGISEPAGDLCAKRLELLKEVLPDAKRIAVLWNSAHRGMTQRYHEIERAATVLGVTCLPLGVREPGDFAQAFDAITQARPNALFLLTDALTRFNMKRVLDYAAAQRLPAIYEIVDAVRAGGLMSYGPSLEDIMQRAAFLGAKLLAGAKPGDVAAEEPTRYYLAVNVRTANSLGINLPESLLSRADDLIQ